MPTWVVSRHSTPTRASSTELRPRHCRIFAHQERLRADYGARYPVLSWLTRDGRQRSYRYRHAGSAGSKPWPCVPHLCPQLASRRLCSCNIHVNHAMLTPSKWTRCLRTRRSGVRVPLAPQRSRILGLSIVHPMCTLPRFSSITPRGLTGSPPTSVMASCANPTNRTHDCSSTCLRARLRDGCVLRPMRRGVRRLVPKRGPVRLDGSARLAR